MRLFRDFEKNVSDIHGSLSQQSNRVLAWETRKACRGREATHKPLQYHAGVPEADDGSRCPYLASHNRISSINTSSAEHRSGKESRCFQIPCDGVTKCAVHAPIACHPGALRPEAFISVICRIVGNQQTAYRRDFEILFHHLPRSSAVSC